MGKEQLMLMTEGLLQLRKYSSILGQKRRRIVRNTRMPILMLLLLGGRLIDLMGS